MASSVKSRVDHVLNYLCRVTPEIDAAESLGIPFDVCVCAAVQKAIRIHEADPRQLELFEGTVQGRKSQ